MKKFLTVMLLAFTIVFGTQAGTSEGSPGFVFVNDYYVFTDRDGTDYYIYYIEYPGAASRYIQSTKVDLKGVKNGKKVLGEVEYVFNPDGREGSYIAVSGKGMQYGLISENAIAKKVYDAINSEDIKRHMR